MRGSFLPANPAGLQVNQLVSQVNRKVPYSCGPRTDPQKLFLYEPVTAVSKSAAAVTEESRYLSTMLAAKSTKLLFFRIDCTDTILPS